MYSCRPSFSFRMIRDACGGNVHPGATQGYQGDTKTSTPTSATSPTTRWRPRPSEVACPAYRAPLIESAGRVCDSINCRFKKQDNTNVGGCSAFGPACEYTIMATDGKYTCTASDYYVCLPCYAPVLSANSTQTRAAASSSTDFPAACAPAAPAPLEPVLLPLLPHFGPLLR